ncbi:MAG: hypothetical protein VB858_05035, partial [Planctomycetaceae bacterium]
RRLIGRRELPTVRQQLVAGKVIDWDQNYSEGRSMRYRKRPEFWRTKKIQCNDARLQHRIRCLIQENERRLLPIHRWLRDRLLLLTFDIKQARSIADGMVPDADSPLLASEYRQLIREQIEHLSDQLNDGTPEFSCDNYGRIHTPITRLPGCLRRCLKIDGRQLQELDLSNSQPLCLGLLAMRFFSDSRFRKSLKNWQPARPARYATSGPPPARATPPITMVRNPQALYAERGYGTALMSDLRLELSDTDTPIGPAGLGEYLDHCQDGTLYERLMTPDYDRSQIKRALFTDVFYGRDHYPSLLRDRFYQAYPAIGFILRELKTGEFRRPSWLMQNEESRLFIGRICNRIQIQQPDIALITIHDSLLTTPEHMNFVESVARSEFARLGVRPKFHRRSYCN